MFTWFYLTIPHPEKKRENEEDMMSGEVFIGQGKVAPQNFLAFTGMLAFPHVLL